MSLCAASKLSPLTPRPSCIVPFVFALAADHPVVRYHRSSHKDKTSVLSAFAVHDYSPICASGSPKPFIEIFDHSGSTLDTIKYHVGFLGQRIGPITTLAFHKSDDSSQQPASECSHTQRHAPHRSQTACLGASSHLNPCFTVCVCVPARVCTWLPSDINCFWPPDPRTRTFPCSQARRAGREETRSLTPNSGRTHRPPTASRTHMRSHSELIHIVGR